MSNLQHTIETYGLSSFLSECWEYIMPMSIFHLLAFIVGCIVLACLNRKQLSTFKTLAVRFGLFIVLLLAVASLFNGLWSCLIFDHLYYSTNYVFDFTPFCPVTLMAVNPQVVDLFGRPFGTTLFQVDAVWFIFALCTWVVTVLLYRLFVRKILKSQTP